MGRCCLTLEAKKKQRSGAESKWPLLTPVINNHQKSTQSPYLRLESHHLRGAHHRNPVSLIFQEPDMEAMVISSRRDPAPSNSLLLNIGVHEVFDYQMPVGKRQAQFPPPGGHVGNGMPFFFLFFLAAPEACGSSLARDGTQATAMS